ncbi:hypothetical protein Tco_0465371 [Tanacetum coccineum]
MGKGLLGPNGESGGKFEGGFGEHCGGNGGIGGSMSEVGEGKDELIGGVGGGSLARRSMVGGEVNGGGVDLGVSKRLSLLLVGDIVWNRKIGKFRSRLVRSRTIVRWKREVGMGGDDVLIIVEAHEGASPALGTSFRASIVHNNGVGERSDPLACFIHKACWQAFPAETYSASVVEMAKAVCFLENHEAVKNVIKNESHFTLEVVDDDLSSLAMFTKHFMRNGGIGGSMSGVGKGKDVSMGGIGGGSLARCSMVSNDRQYGVEDCFAGGRFLARV